MFDNAIESKESRALDRRRSAYPLPRGARYAHSSHTDPSSRGML